MSIILDRVNVFLNSIKSEEYKKTTTGLIDSYSLIQQETEDTLTITSYLQNDSWLKRKIYSPQTAIDTMYLVSNESLNDISTRFRGSKQSLYIYQDDSGLNFSIFEGYDGDRPNIYDNLLVKQYHGSVSEFGPVTFNTDVLIKIEDEKILTILNRLKIYGDYTSNSRPILVKGDAEKQLLIFYSNQTEGRNFICKLETNCFIKEDFTLLLDGQDLKSLLCIFDKTDLESETVVCVSQDNKNITLTNALGSVTIKQLEREINKVAESWVTYFKYEEEEIYGYRVVDLKRIKACLIAQQPNKTYNNKSLKIAAKGLNIVVTKVGDPLEKDYSLANITDIKSAETNWVNLGYNSSSVLKTIDAISKGKLIEEKKEAEVVILLVKKETKIKKGNQIRWLTVFSSKGLEDSNISTTISTIGNPLEKNTEEIL